MPATFVRPSAYWLKHNTAVECIVGMHYDTVREPRDSAEGADVWVLPEYLSAGDYHGGSVGRSNINVFEREHAAILESETAVIVHGSHGYRAIAIRWEAWDHRPRNAARIESDEETLSAEECEKLAQWDELARAMGGLEDYPLLSDDDHSQLESEEEQEAWERWGRSDFRRELQKAFPSLDDALDSADDGKLDTLFWDTCSEVGCYAEHDDEGVSFPFKELLRELSEKTVADALQ